MRSAAAHGAGELLIESRRARDELAGIEELEEEEIEQLKEARPGVAPLRRRLRKAAG